MDSQHFISSIKAHEEVTPGYFLLSLKLPSSVRRPQPGEFFMVKVGRNTDPLLRRPLSLHRLINEDTFQFIYRVSGKGTKTLSERRIGDELDLLGPLGKGFEIPSSLGEAILVAGGIGVAPIFSLSEELKKEKKSVKLFLGGKSKKDILCVKDFEFLGLELFISTEDGSYEKKGVVSELLGDYLRNVYSSRFIVHGERSTVNGLQIYACGPKAMLKKVSELARIYSLPCYISLEERMACGVGACLGCAVKTKGNSSKFKVKSYKKENSEPRTLNSELYKMVCKDGPVFNAKEIDWDG